jgi:hypothetical protein
VPNRSLLDLLLQLFGPFFLGLTTADGVDHTEERILHLLEIIRSLISPLDLTLHRRKEEEE